MTALRVTVCGLLVALLVGPLLAFAGGDVAHDDWNKHPRHGGQNHVDPHRLPWKSMPGTTTRALSPFIGTPLGWVAMTATTFVPSIASPPPFVPPRV